MFQHQKLYVVGIRYGLRGVGRQDWMPSREELRVSKPHPPLGMALRGRSNDTATARERERKDRDEARYDDWSIDHFIFCMQNLIFVMVF